MFRKMKFLYTHIKPATWSIALILIGTSLFVGARLVSPLIFRYVVDNILNAETIPNFFASKTQGLFICAGFIVIAALGEAFGRFLQTRSSSKVSEYFAQNTRNVFFKHIQFLPYQYHQQVSNGDLIQRATSDIDVIRRFLSSQISEFIHGLLTLLISATILFSIHIELTLYSFATLPFLLYFSYAYYKKVSKKFKNVDEAEAAMNTILQENIEGARIVKAFNQEREELQRFDQSLLKHQNELADMVNSMGFFWGVSDGIVLFQLVITIVVGIYYTFSGAVSVGDFIVFSSYIASILYPIRNMGRLLGEIGKVSVSLNRLFEVLDVQEEDVVNGTSKQIDGHIRFDNVSFTYPDATLPTLKNLSFEILPKTTVAIMGPTGSGKSSLIYLLTKLYSYEGNIYLDDVELEDYSSHYLRQQIGLVLQEPFLFSKTIEENIKISQPQASFDEVRQAATVASIDSVIMEFEQGYQTVVGEKGVTLSGGQKQRVAIARTVIGKTPILIFDDSLSAVDTQTDALIQEQLMSLQAKQTMILITHRVNSAKNADQILVLNHGEIVQQGTHAELMNQVGLYQKIARIQNQTGGEVNESGI